MQTGRKYEPVRETRGWYYVEYRPLMGGNKYAWLNLIITEEHSKKEIVNAMEKETKSLSKNKLNSVMYHAV